MNYILNNMDYYLIEEYEEYDRSLILIDRFLTKYPEKYVKHKHNFKSYKNCGIIKKVD